MIEEKDYHLANLEAYLSDRDRLSEKRGIALGVERNIMTMLKMVPLPPLSYNTPESVVNNCRLFNLSRGNLPNRMIGPNLSHSR
ncbi:hypothetical protein ACWOBE_07150 [Hutsoniella sourekii]